MRKSLALVVLLPLLAGGCHVAPMAASALASYAAQKAAEKVVENATVQNACTVVAWGAGLPSVQGYFARLSLREQLLIQTAVAAAGDCAAGSAPAAIGDIAQGLVTVLYTKH